MLNKPSEKGKITHVSDAVRVLSILSSRIDSIPMLDAQSDNPILSMSNASCLGMDSQDDSIDIAKLQRVALGLVSFAADPSSFAKTSLVIRNMNPRNRS